MAHDLDLRDNKHASMISFHQSNSFVRFWLVHTFACLFRNYPILSPQGNTFFT
jgi:hypothetical protein